MSASHPRTLREQFSREQIADALKAFYSLPEDATFTYDLADISSDPRQMEMGFFGITAYYKVK